MPHLEKTALFYFKQSITSLFMPHSLVCRIMFCDLTNVAASFRKVQGGSAEEGQGRRGGVGHRPEESGCHGETTCGPHQAGPYLLPAVPATGRDTD